MASPKIQVPCWPCNGTGKISAGLDGQGNLLEVTCPRCGGNKLVDWGVLFGSSVIPTYKILEVTDSTEYSALDANKKSWYNLFVSAGTLDMADGTKANDLFLAWLFPPGKVTHAAILEIL